ncbi:hypothetical protein [Streptomyces sp. NBC_01462]|uniref:hypothetical protein n=1 Tax=Streptomyces sp. NBC_01462 TaxID=2903876 RepID=UPI002E344AB3|nr:hypothetical protein [Streptomyces sp. NBC_01462]
MTECVENPAARLHSLLLDFCRVGKELGPNQSNWNAWARALSYDGAEVAVGDAEFFRRLGEAKDLPGKVRQAISLTVLDVEHRDYLLEPLGGVDAGLLASTNAAHNIAQVWQHFSDSGDATRSAAIYSLRGCADELRRARVEAGLTEAEGRDLTALINDLMEAVIASTLEETDKQFLLARLNEMLAAVQQARLRGRYAVEAAADATQGALLRRPNLIRRVMDASLFDSFVTFFNKVNALLALVGQTEELTQEAVRAIERGVGG